MAGQSVQYEDAQGNPIQVTPTNPLPVDITPSGSPGSGYKSYEDTSFIAGDSPVVHDINTDLGRNATIGYFYNYGSGDVTLEISEDGASYGDTFLVEAGARVEFTDENIDSLRVTHSGTDTAYTSRFK